MGCNGGILISAARGAPYKNNMHILPGDPGFLLTPNKHNFYNLQIEPFVNYKHVSNEP